MPTSRKRDNAYWKDRLRKDGFQELLERVEGGEMSMYKATQEAGYRAKVPATVEDKLSYHWKRASYKQRMLFIGANYSAVGQLLKDVYQRQKKIDEAKN